jgi:RNA polymerase sigma-54 factor
MAYLEHRLSLKTTQKQVLTPSLVQMVNLLVLNKLELVDMIAEELVENPVLEEATEIVEEPEVESLQEKPEPGDQTDAHYELLNKRDGNAEPTVEKPEPEAHDEDAFRDFDLQEFEKYLSDGASRPREIEVFERPSFENFLARPSTLNDHLEWQLGLVAIDADVRDACASIIGNLNEDGYLAGANEKGVEVPISLEEIANSGPHTLAVVEKALLRVQSFDPPGVGTRDLRECLLIQLSLLDEDNLTAMQIVTDHLRKLQIHQYKEISKVLGRPMMEVLAALELIQTLDPRPGQKYNKPDARLIEPDVYLVKVGANYTVVANEDEVPQLRLNQTYRKMLQKGAAVNKEARNYVKERFKSAVQLLKNIEQRKNIIVKVCEAIVKHQHDFLDHGIDQLKPMMIKDVAEEVGVHPSTVSRAVANKFAHTPQGLRELRFFFSEAVKGTNGRNTSLILVKLKVKRLVENEDAHKPLTDEKLAGLLQEDGISVTRRSVTKYREDLKIPSTHQRRLRI